jgi:hypothetical protein
MKELFRVQSEALIDPICTAVDGGSYVCLFMKICQSDHRIIFTEINSIGRPMGCGRVATSHIQGNGSRLRTRSLKLSILCGVLPHFVWISCGTTTSNSKRDSVFPNYKSKLYT